jgi:geranylgeranyl diphosphate synthase type II
MHDMQSLRDRIEQELTAWQIPASPIELYAPIRYTMAMGGKRMRPLLVLLGCKLFKDDITDAIGPAIAVEVFHNFTLLHDDIMDNAPIRRGKPAVHSKWTSNIAILSGDAMFVLAYKALAKTNVELLPKLMDAFSTTALQVCEGQQLDMNFEQRSDVSIEEYEEMIRLKTAVLLAASLKIGAIAGYATDEQAQALYNFGLNAGIAFQLQDDILDVFGDSHKVGKQQGGDILSNKKTYLLLKAFELANGRQTEELNHWIHATEFNAEAKVEAVKGIYEQLNIRKLAEQRMEFFHGQAKTYLNAIGASYEWKTVLEQFTDSLMHREH